MATSLDNLYTPKQFVKKYPALFKSIHSYRNFMKSRKANGADSFIVKMGNRKTLIDGDKFLEWLGRQNES